MNSRTALLAMYIAALVLIAGEIEVANAACNPMQLSPCLPAVRYSRRPSPMCCARVRQQRPCLCGYLRNPRLKQFIRTAGALRVAKACRIPIPRC